MSNFITLQFRRIKKMKKKNPINFILLHLALQQSDRDCRTVTRPLNRKAYIYCNHKLDMELSPLTHRRLHSFASFKLEPSVEHNHKADLISPWPAKNKIEQQ